MGLDWLAPELVQLPQNDAVRRQNKQAARCKPHRLKPELGRFPDAIRHLAVGFLSRTRRNLRRSSGPIEDGIEALAS